MGKKLMSLLLVICLSSCSALQSQGSSDNMLLGNPSQATATPINKDNYLLMKPQFSLSYNNSKGIPNWVSWHVGASDITKQVKRCKASEDRDDFEPDSSLPAGFTLVNPDDYRGSGFDRGHMTPSGDRTANQEDNCATFVMTNMVPQRPELNRKVWANLEEYSRSLVEQGKELYIVAGPAGEQELLNNKVVVPASTWKVIVVLDRPGQGLGGITAATRVIAVNMPNTKRLGRDWRQYLVTVADIESLTGLDLLSAVPKPVQDQLAREIDHGG